MEIDPISAWRRPGILNDALTAGLATPPLSYAAPPDLPSILSFAIDLARQVGHRIKAGSQNRFAAQTGVDEKKNSVDLVTETDQAVEKFILEKVTEAYPEHKFIGEESYAAGKKVVLGNEPTWIIDPIDGTTNFVHGFPMCCVSIGFTYLGKPVIGVVYNPFLDQLYSAAKGHGAYLNESIKLPLVSPPPVLTSISQALIGVEYGSDRSPEVMDAKLRSFGNLAGQGEGKSMCRGMRSMGSAALNFCAVAAGQLDMYWEIGCWEWDVCAGTIIAQESGGALFGSSSTDLSGDVTPEILTGRKYLIIRGVPAGIDGQRALAKEFYSRIVDWDQN
ncbi:Inositol monophosphatase [Phaffia rhodozyma]|uniref:Inositol-1-monophosphatase n=1 Tax=Phaffia rhodozyma TaxID=264483 RepID=A0A0F7SG91_PHARH|nr:Inositol monophosphatase [Phaffia rhodozyma]